MASKEQALAEFKEGNLKGEVNGFKAVIVSTKNHHYVQYWSDFLINKGISQNSDLTYANFVCVIS